MFDKQIALEAAQGHRGLATRMFAPITTAAEGAVVIREMATVIAVFGALQLLYSLHLGLRFAFLGVLILIPASVLYLSPSRVAGVACLISCLTICAIVFGFAPPKGLVPLAMWAFVIFAAGRASNAAFRRHDLLVRVDPEHASPVEQGSKHDQSTESA